MQNYEFNEIDCYLSVQLRMLIKNFIIHVIYIDIALKERKKRDNFSQGGQHL